MAKDPMEELNSAAAAARKGMGIDKPSKKADEEESDDLNDTDEELDSEEEEESDEEEEEEVEDSPSEESDEADESEEDDEEEEEEDEEEESDENSPQPRKKGVPTKQFNELRGQKRAVESDLKSLLELVGADSLESAKSKLQSLKTVSTAPSEAFVAAAKEMGVEDPENLTKLYQIIAPEIVRSVEDGKVKPLQEQLTKLTSEVEPILHDATIKREWDAFVPTIESTFPQATHSQVKAAEKLMKGFVETEEFTTKDMDFVLYKKLSAFEEIFGARKRKGMVPSKPLPASQERGEDGVLPKIERGNHQSIMEAQKALKKLGAQEDYRDESEDSI